jgi:tRNA threonylcarbamoyladenosine biosynthesis protein TsaE
VAEEWITHSADATVAWGRTFAETLKPPVLVLLSGELGSGKTTLTKGIVAGLHAADENEVTSPTFTLLHEYGEGRKVFHGDLYRVESFHDFETLGLEDVFAKPAIVILEWSEKFPLKSEWPQIRLRLEHLGSDARRISRL